MKRTYHSFGGIPRSWTIIHTRRYGLSGWKQENTSIRWIFCPASIVWAHSSLQRKLLQPSEELLKSPTFVDSTSHKICVHLHKNSLHNSRRGVTSSCLTRGDSDRPIKMHTLHRPLPHLIHLPPPVPLQPLPTFPYPPGKFSFFTPTKQVHICKLKIILTLE